MLSSLRIRLIVICVLIMTFAMVALSAATILNVRSSTLDSLHHDMGQLTERNAVNIAEWVRGKSVVTSSLKLAQNQNDAIPFLIAAREAGSFDDA